MTHPDPNGPLVPLTMVHQLASNQISNFTGAFDLLGYDRTIVFGDFNWDYQKGAAADALAQLRTTHKIVAQTVLPVGPDGGTVEGTYRPNRTGKPKTLDYLLYRGAIGVTPLPCAPRADWAPFTYSDHMPIVYRVRL